MKSWLIRKLGTYFPYIALVFFFLVMNNSSFLMRLCFFFKSIFFYNYRKCFVSCRKQVTKIRFVFSELINSLRVPVYIKTLTCSVVKHDFVHLELSIVMLTSNLKQKSKKEAFIIKESFTRLHSFITKLISILAKNM